MSKYYGNYTEYVEGTVGSIQKTLAIGDILLTSNNSEYRKIFT